MPLHYGSQLDEHHKIRSDAGMFDVSHMLAVEIEGQDARAFLRRLVVIVTSSRNPGNSCCSSCLIPAVVDNIIIYLLGLVRIFR